MKTRLTVLSIALLFSGYLHAETLPVVSSFSILGDVAQQIGGERVQVNNLVGADADSHAYHLTGADVKKIAGAKLVTMNMNMMDTNITIIMATLTHTYGMTLF